MIDDLKFVLKRSFKICIGSLKYFLGIELARYVGESHLCQKKYALKIISQVWLSSSKPCITPMKVDLKLTRVEYNKIFFTKQG